MIVIWIVYKQRMLSNVFMENHFVNFAIIGLSHGEIVTIYNGICLRSRGLKVYSKETELKAVSGICFVSVSVTSDWPLNLHKK